MMSQAVRAPDIEGEVNRSRAGLKRQDDCLIKEIKVNSHAANIHRFTEHQCWLTIKFQHERTFSHHVCVYVICI